MCISFLILSINSHVAGLTSWHLKLSLRAKSWQLSIPALHDEELCTVLFSRSNPFPTSLQQLVKSVARPLLITFKLPHCYLCPFPQGVQSSETVIFIHFIFEQSNQIN